jgi:outer membrane protein assembly factor BamE (lipoprotein component of BamABCDE complex)
MVPTRLRAKRCAVRISGASRFIVSVLAATALSAGAAGTEFVRPPADAVRLGETTRSQIVERFGKPRLERQFRKNGALLRSAEYFFASEAEAPKVPGTRCLRWMIFYLADDTVVGDGFVSACASDHTDFDERKADYIVKGKTRCDDVTAMLGRPAMRGIFPAGVKQGELNLGYVFRYEAGTGRQAKSYLKDLEIVCDPQGVVREVTFDETGSR